MQVARIHIENFRGIKSAELNLTKHVVLLGDNNTGKTTVLEALDLALGPDRLNRLPPVDEHDFYQGRYIIKPKEDVPHATGGVVPLEPASTTQGHGDAQQEAVQATDVVSESALKSASDIAPQIRVDVIVVALSEEQQNRFGDYIEFWDNNSRTLYQEAAPEGIDASVIWPALRVTFIGQYDPEEDDFEGKTFYTLTLKNGVTPQLFSKKDKQICGFLYLRTVRTGSRALALSVEACSTLSYA